MEQKERLHFRLLYFAVLAFVFASCANSKKEGKVITPSFFADTSLVPKDTVLLKKLKLDNGIYYLNSKAFSGYIKEVDEHQHTMMIGSFLNGMQHGTTITFYTNGKLRDSRSYKENKSFGKHFGYWENGNRKFEFYYRNDKREGVNKQWYQGGQPYAFLNFKDDKENGLQQAWRENGRPYINYEAKDGFRYGLQKSGLCYTLIDEKMKIR
jgi:antitoxin component YwqK of YwqJK toxin-antitoxin module